MGKIVDIARQQSTNLNDVDLDALEQEIVEGPKPSDEIPEKYKGKSIKDVITMHEEAEKKASRIANEYGNLKKQVSELEPKKKEDDKVVEKVGVDQLLEDPDKAVGTIVESKVKKLSESVEQMERDSRQRIFEGKHPEYKKDLENEEFIKWATGNPIRNHLAQRADAFDFASAEALWDLWSERKEMVAEVEQAKQEKKKADKEKALKAGTLESGTGSNTDSKKIFKRSEIIDIKTRAKQGDRKAQAIMEDPRWQNAINSAYAEKRVV